MIVQVDDELAVIQLLRATPEVTALVPAANILTQLPPSPQYPYVLVQRVSGQMLTWVTGDQPVLQIDALGGTQPACKKLMLTVRAAIMSVASTVVPAGVIESASEQVGPGWMPDTVSVPPVARYTSRIELVTHP